MDWNAYRYEGHPVAICPHIAPKYLHEGLELVKVLEILLPISISEILRPPHTVKSFRDVHGVFDIRRGLVDVPGPSPRKSAQSHAAQLSDTLSGIHEQLELASRNAQFGVWSSVACWGDFPAGLLTKTIPLPADFNNRLWLTKRRITQLEKAVRQKQQLLRFAMEVVETYAPGQVFQCSDLFTDESQGACQSRLRALMREPQPLIRKAYRDATGVFWERQGGDDAGLRDIHQLTSVADDGTEGKRASG